MPRTRMPSALSNQQREIKEVVSGEKNRYHRIRTYLFTCLNIKTAAGIQPHLFIAPLFSVLKNKEPGANPWVSHSLVRGKLL